MTKPFKEDLVNADPVLQDLKTSGLIEVLQQEGKYFYVRLLEEMAKLADQCSERECSITYIQCADLIGIDRRLEQDKRIEPIEKMVNSLVGSGVIEVVSKRHPHRFRIAKLHMLKAVVDDILSKKVHIPAVSIQFLAR